ncbi:hypothetical protein GCM10023211_00360 [Orbus sasakiae]|uniref:Uncharacterized protein n=1 Tax=Orbus sasakiae TaxID=1078475 RepID=A0ABP9MXY6_9GAMM
MRKAEYLNGESWEEIYIEEFEETVKGKLRDSLHWPKLRCISCNKVVIDKGIMTPNERYSAHFAHKEPPSNGEFCPLSSNTARFSGLKGNAYITSYAQAKERRFNFMDFDSLSRAYIICRHLRGGKGKLAQSEFIEMVRVADSYGVWFYSYLPEWGIPLLLMLMANHPTPNGNSAFFYTLKKDRQRKNIEWQNLNVRLEAHWVNDGAKIQVDKTKNPSFQHEIPFNQQTVQEIVGKEDMSWCCEDTLKVLKIYSEEQLKNMKDK